MVVVAVVEVSSHPTYCPPPPGTCGCGYTAIFVVWTLDSPVYVTTEHSSLQLMGSPAQPYTRQGSLQLQTSPSPGPTLDDPSPTPERAHCS